MQNHLARNQDNQTNQELLDEERDSQEPQDHGLHHAKDSVDESELELEAPSLLREGNGSQKSSEVHDEMRSYLREIGEEPLLRREEEIELAQQIEQGELGVVSALLLNPWIVREFVRLGEKLQNNEISLRKLLRYPEDEPERTGQPNSKEWLLQIIRDLELALRDEIAVPHPNLSDEKSSSQPWLVAKQNMSQVRWHEELLEHFVQQFHTAQDKIHQAETTLNECAQTLQVDQARWKKYMENGLPSTSKSSVPSYLRVSASLWDTMESRIVSAIEQLRHMETEYQQPLSSLKQVLR